MSMYRILCRKILMNFFEYMYICCTEDDFQISNCSCTILYKCLKAQCSVFPFVLYTHYHTEVGTIL